MGLSIFYTLALPESADAEAKLGMLLLDSRELAQTLGVTVSRLRSLTAEDCSKAQAEMNEDFSFARTICRPPGSDRTKALRTMPESAHYFRFSEGGEDGIDIGLGRYRKGAKIELRSADGQDSKPYDGRWYYSNFIDDYSPQEVLFLKALLEKAKLLGFECSYFSEDEDQGGEGLGTPMGFVMPS